MVNQVATFSTLGAMSIDTRAEREELPWGGQGLAGEELRTWRDVEEFRRKNRGYSIEDACKKIGCCSRTYYRAKKKLVASKQEAFGWGSSAGEFNRGKEVEEKEVFPDFNALRHVARDVSLEASIAHVPLSDKHRGYWLDVESYRKLNPQATLKAALEATGIAYHQYKYADDKIQFHDKGEQEVETAEVPKPPKVQEVAPVEMDEALTVADVLKICIDHLELLERGDQVRVQKTLAAFFGVVDP